MKHDLLIKLSAEEPDYSVDFHHNLWDPLMYAIYQFAILN